MWAPLHTLSSSTSLTFRPERIYGSRWGGGGRLFGVRLEDLKPGDDNIKQIGVRAGQKRVRRECV